MAVEHGEVQQVVVDTGDPEPVLVLLPETQHGRAADPRQTDLRGRSSPGQVTPEALTLFTDRSGVELT